MTGRRAPERGRGIGFALFAALLFGASTPLAKAFLPSVAPVLYKTVKAAKEAAAKNAAAEAAAAKEAPAPK